MKQQAAEKRIRYTSAVRFWLWLLPATLWTCVAGFGNLISITVLSFFCAVAGLEFFATKRRTRGDQAVAAIAFSFLLWQLIYSILAAD